MSAIEAGEAGRPAVIFLHGLGTGARAWQPQMDALAGDYHVLALYQPGYHTAPGPFTLDRAVEGIDAIFERHGLERAHFCGLSLGTMVALTYALREPARASSLALCGGFASLTEEMRALTLQGAASMRAGPDDAVRADMASNVPEKHRAASLADLESVTGADLASIVEQMADFDVTGRLGEIHSPTLVLCGDQDIYNLPFCEALAEGIRGARLEVIPNAGHVANLDNPEAFTSALRSLLQAIAP
jgi:3-oxoadipate enol-lactonase